MLNNCGCGFLHNILASDFHFVTWLVNSIEFGGHLFQPVQLHGTTSDTGEDAAFTSDMYNRRLLAIYVPTYQSGIFFWLLLQLAICLLV